jgi:hypothetical protein
VRRETVPDSLAVRAAPFALLTYIPIMRASMSLIPIFVLSLLLIAPIIPARAQSLEGRWRLIGAQEVRANGEVVHRPWGAHPIGSLLVQGGAQPLRDQMKATLLSSYVGYSGACAFSEKDGTLSIKVDAAWRPEMVGTEQKRVFRFENGKLIYGPAGAVRTGSETLTRRLTFERIP